jgi:hypothetical protein
LLRDQAAGGGRTKLVLEGRKILGAVASTFAIGATTITGTGDTFCVFRLALGAEQIEQECWDIFALTGCEWTACTVPIANNSNTERTAMALMIGLRLVLIRCLMSMRLAV